MYVNFLHISALNLPINTRSFLQPSFSHSFFFFRKRIPVNKKLRENLWRHFDVTSSADLPWDRGYLSSSPSLSSKHLKTNPIKKDFPPFRKLKNGLHPRLVMIIINRSIPPPSPPDISSPHSSVGSWPYLCWP